MWGRMGIERSRAGRDRHVSRLWSRSRSLDDRADHRRSRPRGGGGLGRIAAIQKRLEKTVTAEKGFTMATVGVLCARARVEEKAIMAALAEAGIVSALFPPADEPLPVGPLPTAVTSHAFPVPQLVVDRHPNRQIARAVLATCRALGVPALCAGIAGSGDRLDVASTLATYGLPRPLTALCTSEDAALEAVAAMGLPATLLPLDLRSA